MSERLQEKGSFGTCPDCGKARESDVQDGDLVLICIDGHVSS